jgi:hypothetical protein
VGIGLNRVKCWKSIAQNLPFMKMKIMRVVFLALMTLPAQLIFAQDKTNEERAKALTQKMKENLSLKDDQYEKVYTINLAFVNKATQVKESSGGRLGKARKLKDADGERDKMMKGVLTEEQYKKYKEQKAENRKEMKKRYNERKEG